MNPMKSLLRGGLFSVVWFVLNSSVWAGIYSQVISSDDPVAYWRLGESSTTQTAVNAATGSRSAGTAANGTYTSGVGVGTPGLILNDSDTAIKITSGTPDRMATSGFEKLGTSGTGYTVEYWTKLATTPTGAMNMVGDREGGTDFYLMSYLLSGGTVRAHTNTANGYTSINSVPKLNPDKIYHVVTTWDATTGWMKIYINGREVATTSGEGTHPNPGPAKNTSNPIYIGKDGSEPVCATVVIDEAAIYNRPLTPASILNHYLAGRLGTTDSGNLTFPVSYWNFDESASGTGTAYDVFDGNDGTFQNGATRTAGLIGAGSTLFNYGQQAVNVGSGVNNNFSFTTGITLEALIQPSTSLGTQRYEHIFRKDDGDNRILFSFQEYGNYLSFGLNTNGYAELDMPLNGEEGRPTLADFKDGKPHHVLATYDAATGEKAIWVDGVQCYSTFLPPGTLITSGGTATAYIGNTGGLKEPFTGIIDEVAIYAKALPASEIWHHYQNVLLGQNYFYIPEPTTWSLALLGGIFLGVLRGCRRRGARGPGSPKPTH